ncbi:hypothetical protein H2200_010338 [Cladophialophora chaetospira]|uniref:Uncharacterized protein n=1 Tax=Cladophialophora chaetospira TaxID=386627 RepID=A0AA38X1A7_9EURO|nr:hypothetical protein H2200_010338 [Cladophialophora chaetospira]
MKGAIALNCKPMSDTEADFGNEMAHTADRTLPAYDGGTKIRAFALTGLILFWIYGVLCVAGASVLFARPAHFKVNNFNGRLPAGFATVNNLEWLYSLILTIVITVCSEGTGFIHDVSLRWNMFDEGRLRWITNLRLVSTSRETIATSYASNLLYFLTVALAYTSSSQIFLPAAFASGDEAYPVFDGVSTVVSAAGVLTLGLCVLVQSALITWTFLASRQNIKTWSSSPLTVTLACAASDNLLPDDNHNVRHSSLAPAAIRIAQRMQQEAHHQLNQSSSAMPQEKQPSLFTTRKRSARWTLAIVTVLPIAILIWALIVLHAWKTKHQTASLSDFAGNGNKMKNIAALASGAASGIPVPGIRVFPWQQTGGTARMNTSTTTLVDLLLIFTMQAYLTLAMHCVEVLINSVRDQKAWEQAAKDIAKEKVASKGAILNPSILVSTLGSWPNLFLLACKATSQWLFNRALLTVLFFDADKDLDKWDNYETEIIVFSVPTFFLVGLTAVLVTLAWYLAFRVPRNFQPSTYGHVRTLLDLIDDWGQGDQLFWGDKGLATDGLARRAGTAGDAELLGPINADTQYV